jgi:hypothetical protein
MKYSREPRDASHAYICPKYEKSSMFSAVGIINRHFRVALYLSFPDFDARVSESDEALV